MALLSKPCFRLHLSLIVAFLFLGCAEPAAESELLVGETLYNEKAPEFSEETLNGQLFTHEDLQGKVTLVNFWATWCGPCVIETPELVGLQEEWKDRPFQVLGVSMDETGFDAVRPFVDDFMVNYPQIIDLGPLADKFGGVYALPTTFLVDGDGTVISGHLGIFPFEEKRRW